VNESDAAGDFAGFEAQRRAAMMRLSPYRSRRGLVTPLDEYRATQYGRKRPVTTHVCAPPRPTYVPPPGEERRMPVQRAVDRSEQFSPTTIDIEIRDGGKVVEILRFPVNGRYWTDPNDPVVFPDFVDSRVAICGLLAPFAAARCLAAGGAW
jgi:hypothetical protein